MTKKFYKILIILIIILLILIVLFRIVKVQDVLLKLVYPKKYSEYVDKYAEQYNVDENLVYSVIKVESNFDVNVTSNKNAKGLMQLLDSTAQELAQEENMEYNENTSLYNPEINIMLGTKYLSKLLDKYNNNIYMAVIAYNAGIGNVDKWISNNIISEDGSDIENVPYKETNSYVRKIIRDYNIYKKIY